MWEIILFVIQMEEEIFKRETMGVWKVCSRCETMSDLVFFIFLVYLLLLSSMKIRMQEMKLSLRAFWFFHFLSGFTEWQKKKILKYSR